MPRRTKALAFAGLVTIFLWAWVLTPWSDVLSLVLVAGIAPAATLFAVIYGFTVPWWQTPIGRAMLVSSWGLALLVDISLLYQAFGDNYFLRDAVKLTVFTLVFLGAWFKLGALLLEKWRARRENRGSEYGTRDH